MDCFHDIVFGGEDVHIFWQVLRLVELVMMTTAMDAEEDDDAEMKDY